MSFDMEHLGGEMKEQQKGEKFYEYYKRSLPVMQEHFLIDLVEGRIPEDQIEEKNCLCEMNLNAALYAVCVFQADMRDRKKEQKRECSLSLKTFVEKNVRDIENLRSFLYLDRVVVVMLLTETVNFHKKIQEMNRICKAAGRMLDMNVTAGIGQTVRERRKLKESYQNAVDAVNYRILVGKNQAIYIRDIYQTVDWEFELEDWDIQRLVKAVKLEKKQEVKLAVTALMEKFRNSNISLQKYQMAMMELTAEFLKLGRTYHLRPEEIFEGEEKDFFREITNFDSLDSLGKWLYQIGIRLRSLIRQEQTDSAKLLTEKAKHYIQEHYAESKLSVESLCRHLNVSAAYFSTIFKKEMGQSFVMYLTNVRMEAALELLNNTQDKTYVIAEKVGYAEPNYFSCVFRKKYGMSPTKYRLSKKEEHDQE